jgi:hypothetical protein
VLRALVHIEIKLKVSLNFGNYLFASPNQPISMELMWEFLLTTPKQQTGSSAVSTVTGYRQDN